MLEDLKIIFYPDPRLRKVSKPVKEFGAELAQLTRRMFELMRANKGVGLAAPQVGKNIRLFVMNPTGEPKDDRIVINPVLTDPDGEESGEEGCLSIPDIKVDVVRSKTLKLTAQDLTGQTFEWADTGYVTRVWQHEIDHLNGTLLIDRMGALAKMTHRRKLKELEDQYAAEHPTAEKKEAEVTVPASTASPRIIFAGSGAFGLPTLRALAAGVVQVVSAVDHPAGRGRKLTPTPVAAFALENNLPLLRTADINREILLEADVLVVIAFGQKISQAQANRPRLGSVNLHASLLPKYRGAAPINWAILRGETITGNSVIRLAERMDAGDILGQSQRPIADGQTAGELHDLLAEDGPALVSAVLADLAAGKITARVQDESQATAAGKISRADAKINWAESADAVSRRICGLWPWPGCRVRLVDATGGEIGRISLARAKVAEGEGPRWTNGEIETTGHVCVAGGAASVEILELQPEGGRVMSLSDFRRGHAWMAGMRIVDCA